MLAIVASEVRRPRKPHGALRSVYLYLVCVPLGGGAKIMCVIRSFEESVERPTLAMEFLFSLGLLRPVLSGLIPIGVVMRLATG